jgi:hypothetical protein
MEKSAVLDERAAELDLIVGDLEAELVQADLEANPSTCTRLIFCE